VNHSAKADIFAINFAHLYKIAADYRYSLPEVNELQTALRHSLHYRFVEAIKPFKAKSQVQQNDAGSLKNQCHHGTNPNLTRGNHLCIN
jgi:hypothetical protein